MTKSDDHSQGDSTLLFQPVWLNTVSQITRPDRTIAIAEYDWNRWLPLLGPDRWVLVHKLRAMYVFQPGDTEPGHCAMIQTDLATLGAQLGLPFSRVQAILSSDPIPDEKRWRQIRIPKPGTRNRQESAYAYYLRFFIPRLRYHYLPQEGRPPRPAGFIIELVLDLLPTPEDAKRLGFSLKSLQRLQAESLNSPPVIATTITGSLKSLQRSQGDSPEIATRITGSLKSLQASITTTTTTIDKEKDLFEPTWRHFAGRQGEPEYRPSDKDCKKLAGLLSDGITEQQIMAGIDKAFADYRISRKRGRIQRFAYCVPVIRSLTAAEAVPPFAPPRETSAHEKPATDQPAPSSSSEIPGTVPSVGVETDTREPTQPPLPIAGPASSSQDQAEDSAELLNSAPGEPAATDDEIVAHYALAKATLGDIPTDDAVDAWERARLRRLAAEYHDVAEQGSPPSTGRDWVRAAIDEARASPTTYEMSIKLLETILARWVKEGFRSDRQFSRRPSTPRPDRSRKGSGIQPSTWTTTAEIPDFGARAGPPPTPAQVLWKKAAGQLELQMTHATYDQWVRPLAPLSLDLSSGLLVLQAESPLALAWLTERLQKSVTDAVSGFSDNGPIRVEFVLPEQESQT